MTPEEMKKEEEIDEKGWKSFDSCKNHQWFLIEKSPEGSEYDNESGKFLGGDPALGYWLHFVCPNCSTSNFTHSDRDFWSIP